MNNNNFSTTGYKDNSEDRNNAYNIIPGNLITMKGVSRQLTLVPIVNGKPQYDRKRLAKPGDEDIEFESDVESVLEMPYAQIGIQLPFNFQTAINPVENFNTALNYGMGVHGNSYAENSNPMTTTAVTQTTSPAVPPAMKLVAPSIAELESGERKYLQKIDNRARTVEMGTDVLPSMTGDPNQRQLQEDAKVKTDVGQKKNPFIGAINPYGGWNMENTTAALGAFAQNKNILGTAAAAGKLVLSGARNYFSGAAAMKNYQESLDDYEKKEEENQRSQGWHWLQKGGKIGKILTGSYIEGDEDGFNEIQKYRDILSTAKILKEEFDPVNNEYIISYE